MQFIYQNSSIPLGKELIEEINKAAARINDRLLNVNVSKLGISEYNQRYFRSYLVNLRSTLQRYSFIIAWSVANTTVPIEKRVFVEYGGGSGILSLLAKELDFGTVIYSDIYDVSCDDAKIIGAEIGNQADYYLVGDIDDITAKLNSRGIRCNSLVSNDVIEHIYDVESFLQKLPQIADEADSVIVMASSANSSNPIVNFQLKKEHYAAEFKDRKEYFGRKKRDSLESYYKIRKRIIQNNIVHANREAIKELTERTRGMIERDIIQVVTNYSKNKTLPPRPRHPTNTCDPYTGNWAENLMDLCRLRSQLASAGFDARIIAGYFSNFYGVRNVLPKLNWVINRLGKYGIHIAPFFVLLGKTPVGPKIQISQSRQQH